MSCTSGTAGASAAIAAEESNKPKDADKTARRMRIPAIHHAGKLQSGKDSGKLQERHARPPRRGCRYFLLRMQVFTSRGGSHPRLHRPTFGSMERALLTSISPPVRSPRFCFATPRL